MLHNVTLKTACIILLVTIISCTTTNVDSKKYGSTDHQKLLLLSNLYIRNNNLVEADNLLYSVQQSSRDSKWYASNALLQVALGSFDLAEHSYQTAFKLNDNNFDAKLNYSSLLIKMLSYKKAIKKLNLLMQSTAVSTNILSYAYFNLGFIYYKKQQTDKATKYFLMSARKCMNCIHTSEAIKIYAYYFDLLNEYKQKPVNIDKNNAVALSCRVGDYDWLQKYDWYMDKYSMKSIKC